MSQTEEQVDDPNSIPEIGLVPRPPWQLQLLPPRWRWEATRRHPYYQRFWRLGHEHFAFRRGSPASIENVLQRIEAAEALRLIGVRTEAPDPKLNYSQLDQLEEHFGWVSQAVLPCKMLHFAGQLLSWLPPETLLRLGSAFTEAGQLAPNQSRYSIYKGLENSDDVALHCYPGSPIVAINPAASQQDVVADTIGVHSKWKSHQNLGDQRLRDDKFPDYFRVFDQREGWCEGSYHSGSDRNFSTICKELKVSSIKTVHNHYTAAFKIIMGHDYSPELWHRLLGPLKFSVDASEIGPVVLRRPRRNRSPREVTATAIGIDINTSSHKFDLPLNFEDISGLYENIQQLIKDGKSTNEILKACSLKKEARPAIDAIRTRIADMLNSDSEK